MLDQSIPILLMGFLLLSAVTANEVDHDQSVDVPIILHFSKYASYMALKASTETICYRLQIPCEYENHQHLSYHKDAELRSDFLPLKTSANGFKLLNAKQVELEGIKAVTKDRMVAFKPMQDSSGFLARTYDYHFKHSITDLFGFRELWQRGITGRGVKVAVFDTGVSDSYQQANDKNIKEIKNWSSEKYSGVDFDGHGTFVAGLISNSNSECPGIAPDVDLYIFKVFTKTQETFTSWFLDALNYAIQTKIDIINFSIGTTDFTDNPFVMKIREAVESGITIVAAAGNDGPVFGSINNPADQMEVIAVGGLDSDGETLAPFSSRGMTTWELSHGAGRVKPDLVTHSRYLSSSGLSNECSIRSGTSIAVPIVSGSLALVISAMRQQYNMADKVNPAFLRQLLTRSAKRLSNLSMFEQGAGMMNIQGMMEELSKDSAEFGVFPNAFDLRPEQIYASPYSLQPLYSTGMPAIFNTTLLNNNHKPALVENAKWISDASPNDALIFNLNYQENASTYFTHFSFSIGVKQHLFIPIESGNSLVLKGKLRIYLALQTRENNAEEAKSEVVDIYLAVPVVFTPDKSKRVLWDQFHSLKYPESSYIPRDSLSNFDYPYDWLGDHPFTNFIDVFHTLRSKGYYLEILRGTFECYDARNYGILMIVDPEETYSPEEIYKLENDVMIHGLSVVVLADWYDTSIMAKNSFRNKLNGQELKPLTGGANVPALNALLERFGIALGSTSFAGDFDIGDMRLSYLSGSYIARFPRNGYLFTFDLINETDIILAQKPFKAIPTQQVPVLGLLHTIYGQPGSGKIVVYGDSNLVDAMSSMANGQRLFADMLDFIETKSMKIFDEFTNLELPSDYEFQNHNVEFQNTTSEAIKNISKHAASHKWIPINHCHMTLFDGIRYDFSKHQDYLTPSSTITDWISHQNTKGPSLWILESGLIQLGIMTCSCICMVFLGYVMRRKRRKPKYTKLSQQNPIILV